MATASKSAQQDYYGRRCGTLLYSYCISTYTEVTSAASLK